MSTRTTSTCNNSSSTGRKRIRNGRSGRLEIPPGGRHRRIRAGRSPSSEGDARRIDTYGPCGAPRQAHPGIGGSGLAGARCEDEGACPRQSSMQKKNWLILPVVICLSHWLSCSKKEFEVRFFPGPPNCVFSISEASPEPRRVQPTKKWPRKKRMASWARQQQQITEAADGGARACTGADGAIALNLRTGS